MKYFFLLFFLALESGFACEMQLPYHLVVLNDEQTGKEIFQTKNCSLKASEDLHQIIVGLEGRIASFQLQELMSNKGHQVELQPQSIVIQQFSTILRDQLPLPKGVQAKSSRLQDGQGLLALSAGDRLDIACSTCLFGTSQPINIKVIEFDGSQRSFMATTDFIKMVKALKLISPLASFSSLDDLSLLKEEYIESIPHTDLITDKDSLKFYKTNKPLRAGEFLKKSDLNAVNLVRAGLKTDVILENQMIRIKTQGISRSNGSIGELVEVYHQQKNKKYQGKVVDINKVLVEL
jgi:flagella basal body P-ring formation protein FlgA